MVQKVTLSPGAIDDFNDAVAYLKDQFSDIAVTKFAERVNEKIELIISHPRLGRKVGSKSNIYKTVLNGRIVLYYRYKPLKKEIIIIAFWNTLQHPRKLRL